MPQFQRPRIVARIAHNAQLCIEVSSVVDQCPACLASSLMHCSFTLQLDVPVYDAAVALQEVQRAAHVVLCTAFIASTRCRKLPDHHSRVR